MDENLINLITQLSLEIIRQSLAIQNDAFESKKKSGYFNKYVRKLRRKCLDIIIQKNPEMDYSDPCKTHYGADWNPLFLILDYVGELANYGAEKLNKRLNINVQILEGKKLLCLQDMYKLLFLLRGSYMDWEEELQPGFLSTVSQYSLKSQCPASYIYPEVNKMTADMTIVSDGLLRKFSTNLFQNGCQLLTKLSMRNIALEKGKSRQLSFSSSKILGSDCNDLIMYPRSFSNSTFMQVASSLCSSKSSLLDTFVEKPITYKMRRITAKNQSSCVTEISGGSGESNRNGCEMQFTENLICIERPDNYWTEVCDIEKEMKLKRYNENFNASDLPGLYPIMKEHKLKLQNYESCFDRKIKSEDKNSRQMIRNSFFQSTKTLILALWEQDFYFKSTYCPGNISDIQEIRILELESFLKDVQFLLVGIGTDTFQIDQGELCFAMKNGTCLEGITPNTLLSFSKEYLEIGTCYIKLSHHTKLNLRKQIVSGAKNCRIILKVFWLSIYDYLCRHSHYVLKIPLNLGLIEFKSYVKNLYPMITVVEQLCRISEKDEALPQGGQLLSYILEASQKINNNCAAGVVFGILKACCEIYLLQLLQEWMFQGHLDRHHRDFFVEHRPKKRGSKDRSYYLSFFMVKERIPCFLKGIENNVFNCGKTIHLLKLIQPNSTLCRLLEARTYPRMKLCLSRSELKEQSNKFLHYSEYVANICGRFTSISSLKLEEVTKRSNYEKFIMEVKKKQELQREKLRKKSLEELRRKREEQNQWLNEQIQLAAKEKIRKKELEERESRLFTNKVREITENERRIIEEEKRNMKMFYEELMDEIDKRKAESHSWNQQSLQMNKKNSSLNDCKSDDENTFPCNKSPDTKDLNMARLDSDNNVDSEGNIVTSNIEVNESELDVVNSNVESIENRLAEDIQNENIVIPGETESQLQKLIDSRKEYENVIGSDTIGTKIESDKPNTPSKDSRQSPKSIKSMNQKNKSEGTIIKTRAIPRNVAMNEAQLNKNKMMSCEFGIGAKEEEKRPVSRAPPRDSEAAKNKARVMASEYNYERRDNKTEEKKEIKRKVLTEAEKNKAKVMASEYGYAKGDKTKEKTQDKKKVMTEAERNKKKVMSSEYDMSLKNDQNEQPIKKSNHGESEVQKNKKKIMASEFGLPAEPDKVEGKKEKDAAVETEAQRNKRKVLGTEFGESKPEPIKGRSRGVCGAEAERNRKRFLETEYGYPKEPTVQDKSEAKECKAADAETEKLTEEEELDRYINSELLMRPSFITEKALDIFNKRCSSEDLRFFTLNESIEENFPDEFSRNHFSEVQILFEQHLRKPTTIADVTTIAAGLTGMDTTTFMNSLRQSVLIPLKIQEAIANEALFNHLLVKEDMLSHLNALRNYYFLNDGEFGRRLTQNMFATLAKCKEPQQFFKRSTMNEIVYEALNYTIHSNEPYTQNVSFEIVCMPPFLSHASHDVLSPFELSYQVKWPLNIIITESALEKYKLVFHFLLKLKRINWTLNENFSYLTYTCKEKHIKSKLLINSPHYHRIHIYRHAMGQFMRTLENYTSSCSLQFSWINFEKELESAKNIDELYDKHVRYIKEVLKRCFLTKESHELMSCINQLIEMILKYHFATKSGAWVLVDGEYQHTKFEVLRDTFIDYCNMSSHFLTILRKKINLYKDLKPHEVLMEKFDMILH